MEPIICFGQQPCGFFPKRFLVAKIWTAWRLQQEIGGRVVFFYHDSDHDSRETRTVLRRRQGHAAVQMNFAFANKLQRKYSPLYVKRVLPEWHAETLRRLPDYVEPAAVEAFSRAPVTNVADFCLHMYDAMGLLNGIELVRSSDPDLRRKACPVADYYADVAYEGETVRARCQGDTLQLHAGGDVFLTVPPVSFGPEQISPARDTRLPWMQSVIGCTHYVAGASEQHYLCEADAPEITYVKRDPIESSDDAYTNFTA